jgi:hypothetical protein
VIRSRSSLSLARSASSRTLKVLKSYPSHRFLHESAAFTNDTIAGVEWFPALEELSLMRCMQVDSVTRLATSKSLKKLDLKGTSVTDEAQAGIAG